MAGVELMLSVGIKINNYLHIFGVLQPPKACKSEENTTRGSPR